MKNNTLLVACAMRVEADVFINSLDNIKEVKIGNFYFYEGNYEGCNVVVLISGPGVVNMASALTIGINCYNPSCVFNYGVVGGIGEDIHQGDIIVCNECMNLGSYMTGKISKGNGININKWDFMTFTDGGIDELVIWKCDNELLDLVIDMKDSYDNWNVLVGRIGSSDVWDKEYDKLVMFRDKYDIMVEDMECISVYQVSNMFNVPCLSVKVVSDNAILGEGYDKSVLDKSKEFIVLILEKLCDNMMKNDEIEGE